MDPAVALVSAYLRLNGYFLLTEFEVHDRREGRLRTLTDVDILALRPPTATGPPHYAGSSHGTEECLVVTEVDPAFGVAERLFDIVIGEVKKGGAAVNPSLATPSVLHAALRRVGDVLGLPTDRVVDGLMARGSVLTATAQVRLVAFGAHGSPPRVTAMAHRHLLDNVRRHLRRRPELSRATRYSDPVLALLELVERLEPSPAP
jgi:hypothetical protein